jgi:hypothetical protein
VIYNVGYLHTSNPGYDRDDTSCPLKNNGILFHKAKNLNLTCIINLRIYIKQTEIKACVKTKAVYKIYKCGINTVSTKQCSLKDINILSFDLSFSDV